MILHLIEDLVKHMKRGKRKMNQAERRIYLIKYLLSEQIHFRLQNWINGSTFFREILQRFRWMQS